MCLFYGGRDEALQLYNMVLNKELDDLVAQLVKNLPAVQQTWVQSLGREDPLEKEMATHSSTLAWRIPRTEEPSRIQPIGSQRVGHNCATNFFTFSENHVGKLNRLELELLNYNAKA